MKEKLSSFTKFANSLYPHESEYLLSNNKFIDVDNKRILDAIHYNCQNQLSPIAYDINIDKRKYDNVYRMERKAGYR